MQKRATLAEKLNAILDKRGLTQADLARMANISTAQAAYICTGRTKNPQFQTMVQIARALEIPLEYFAE